MRLLVVEDDHVMGQALCKGLREAGQEPVWISDGLQVAPRARAEDFDAIILDIMLPGRSGLDVLRELRTAEVKIPIIMVTALGTVRDRVTGLGLGADDYLVKPFAVAELLARLEAVCRRTVLPSSSLLTAGDLKLDLETRSVRRGGQALELTPTQFGVLELLMRYAGQVVTRKMLCEHLWEADWEGATNIIDVHIKNLRAKIDDAGSPSLIQTVRGRGYSLVAP